MQSFLVSIIFIFEGALEVNSTKSTTRFFCPAKAIKMIIMSLVF